MNALTRLRLTSAMVTAAALALTAACGVPADGTTRTVADDDVPYRLLLDVPVSPTPSHSQSGAVTIPQVFLLDQDGQLIPQPLEVANGSAQEVGDAALRALATGPTETQRAGGLSSALGPDVQLRLLDLAGGTARVGLDVPDTGVSADRLPLAVGQIVLTAVSVQGVDRVLLVQDGQPVGAPLPGGEQTFEALVAADYAPLLAIGAARPLKASTSPSP